jgi:flagellar protein FlaG
MNSNPIAPLSGASSDPTSVVAVTSAAGAGTSTPSTSSSSTPQTPSQDPADYQLVIQDDKAAGSFVYMTIDRRTGQVVSQLPREEVIKMREAFDYASGAVISTKV